MSNEQPTERVSRIQWTVIVISLLSLLVAFGGLNYQNISSWVSQRFFPKTDFVVKSWTTPTSFPNGSTYFLQSLSVSPKYFVVTTVSLKSEKPYIGEPLRIHISFENIGKKSVEQPRVVIYFSDYMYRVWNVWSKSDATDILTKGCSLEYHFPSLDQKTVGVWGFFVLLYDDADGVLVSYEAKEFTATDVPPTSWWQLLISLVVVSAGGLFVGLFAGFVLADLKTRLTSWLRRRRKSKNTAKKENPNETD